MDGGAGAGLSLALERVTIDLAALAENWRALAAMAPGAETAAVVKADAYGIGVEPAMRTLAAAGCRTFFVATPEEGRQARTILPSATIYVLDGLPPGSASVLAESRLRPVLGSMSEVREWARWRRDGGSGEAALHADTGMNRLGLSPAEIEELMAEPGLLDAVAPALLMSHLACADRPESPHNGAQLARFAALRARMPALPCSLANSAGIQLGAPYQFDLTRPGILLYGGRGIADRPPLRTVVTTEARVLRVGEAPEGAVVGYGSAQRLMRPSCLATIAIGYADGYLRSAGSSDVRPGAAMFLGGRRVPIVGRVSMDLVVVDVTDSGPVARGNWAEVIGPNMPVDEVAEMAGTISYEFLTGLSRRAERRYVGR